MKPFLFFTALLLMVSAECQLQGQTPQKVVRSPNIRVLDAALQDRLDQSVVRSLKWLASQQKPDGSFPSLDDGQPGVTSLCVMAFLANGHSAGEGEYGDALMHAVDYIIAQQRPNGLIARNGPMASPISRQVEHRVGYTSVYNHALSALTLSECYGQLQDDQATRGSVAIEKAIAATIEMQNWRKLTPSDQGGWRYINKFSPYIDSDLSVSGWMLMSLRSSRNAGFEVETKNINEAVKYIDTCYKRGEGSFIYHPGRTVHSRAMAGAGILALAHAGKHDSARAKSSGDWILRHSFDDYNGKKSGDTEDRYHYGLLTCCQAMYQLGGKHWKEFYPPTVTTMLDNQQKDGSWEPESNAKDRAFGECYTTALCVLSLSAANDLLPIFQR